MATTHDQRVRLIFCLFVALVMAFALTMFAGAILQDPDSWWQVKVGLDFLANRTFPTVDPYSHTFAGEPWIAKEWLGQVLLALAYQAGGWNGVVALIIATISLTVFLMAWFLGAWLKPTLAIGLAFVAASLISPIYTARPHIFTLPIIVVWTAMLFEAARQERAPPWWLLALVVAVGEPACDIHLGLRHRGLCRPGSAGAHTSVEARRYWPDGSLSGCYVPWSA